jgi:hypothetical protein
MNSFIYCRLDRRARPASGIKRLADYPDQRHMFGTFAEHVGSHEALWQGWRVWIEPLRRLHAQNVCLVIKENGARRMFVRRYAINQDHCMQSRDAMRQVECGRAEVSDFNIVGKSVLRFQKTNYVWTDGVVAEQDVSDSTD